ncbi:hypothetical protein SNK04_000837 [Fusarium graminearum]
MPTDKGKDNVQPDTKEDKRHKFINDIDAMIKELRDLTDEVEHDILKLRQSCSHATISNQNQGQGQDKGASSWSAAPEDVDTDKWYITRWPVSVSPRTTQDDKNDNEPADGEW